MRLKIVHAGVVFLTHQFYSKSTHQKSKSLPNLSNNFTSSYFQCWSDKIIPISQKCDCNNDCGDWEDEENCPKKPENSPFISCEGSDSFGPYRCIPRKWLCDGLDQCGNNWDESEKACDIKIQQESELFLNSPLFASHQAVSSEIEVWTDENVNKCRDDQFFCNNPGSEFTCIDKNFVCDGENDCGNADDEADELCQWKFVKFHDSKSLDNLKSLEEYPDLNCQKRPSYAHDFWDLQYTEITYWDDNRALTKPRLSKIEPCVKRSLKQEYFNRFPDNNKVCTRPSRLRCKNTL